MKKFNFCTSPSDQAQPAIIDVNNIAPMDFVGNLCVSKLKIPRNTLPVALVPPMGYEFTAEEKAEVDAVGYTPTEMYYVVFSHLVDEAVAGQANCSGNTSQFFKSGTDNWKSYSGSSGNFVLTNENCFVARLMTFWMYDKPRWKQLENGNFVLTNEDKPIYAWWGPESRLLVREYYKYISAQTVRFWAEIRNVYDHFIMDTKVITANSHEMYAYTTPIIALSQWLTQVNGLTSAYATHVVLDENITFNSGGNGKFLYTDIPLEVMRADVTYNPVFQNTLNTGEMLPPFSLIVDMSATYNFKNFNQTELLFPVNHIAIQCLDLNYEPEDISINTVDLEGVINPSHMYFLKTFLISTRGGLSDFLYIEDKTTANTIEVNSPRITRLQFRFLWIDTNQIVHNLELWRNNVITLQLILYPPDFSESTKKARITFDS